MAGKGNSFSQTFFFYNNQSQNIKVTGIDLADNMLGFSITNVTPFNSLPISLKPGDTLTVTITLATSSNNVVYDELIITTEVGIVATHFKLQGLRDEPNITSVRTEPAVDEVTLSLLPNPSNGEVAIVLGGSLNSRIEIYDALGRLLIRRSNVTEWDWNSAESHIPPGSYFVRASGNSAKGIPFVETRRLLISK
jgi:hypothetical protein